MSEKILRKVRSLLSQAEDPAATPAEAEAFSRKAEELIARHAIDTAMIEQQAGWGMPTTRKIATQNPYGKAKACLLHGIAQAHNSRVVMHRDKSLTMVGFQSDLDMVEMLYTSLLIQGTNAVLSSPHGGKSFRASFWYAFSNRVSQRLAEQRKEATEQAAPGTGLVLVERTHDVEQVFSAEFPRVGKATAGRITSREGVNAGRAAADRADFGGRSVGGNRRAIA